MTQLKPENVQVLTMNENEADVTRAPESPEVRLIRSETIFGVDRLVIIVHGDAHYRLQITKAGKLILTK